VLLGNGDGTFGPPQSFPAGAGARHLASGDINNDGKRDLIVAAQNASAIALLVGNGDGTFQAPQLIALTGAPNGVAVGELNGDGVIDVVGSSSGGNNASVIRSTP
jgi:hypothetical protein